MSTAKPIAPRKSGKSPESGHNLTRSGATGKFTQATVTRHTAGKQLAYTVTGVRVGGRAEMLVKVKKGLAFKAIEKLEKALHSTRKEMAVVLSIPVSTMTRRKQEGLLRVDESDRVVRVAQLFDAAVAMMYDDTQAALAWLRTPLEILGNEAPLEHAATELGARDVEDLIGRIRHGVFS